MKYHCLCVTNVRRHFLCLIIAMTHRLCAASAMTHYKIYKHHIISVWTKLFELTLKFAWTNIGLASMFTEAIEI